MAERATAPIDRAAHYIDVLLRVGANVQRGQTLLIVNAPTDPGSVEFAHRMVECAYALGAGNVVVQWKDPTLLRERALHATEEVLRVGPVWQGREMNDLLHAGAAYVRLEESDPEVFAGADPARVALMTQGRIAALREATVFRMADGCAWTIGGIATPGWARLVFPQKSERQAVAALWRVIYAVARADQPDPVAAWHEHLRHLRERADYLNAQRFRRLHYRAPGTDLWLELPEGHQWISAGHSTPSHAPSVANIPTEEVYSMPKRDGVNGTVTSTLPLVLGGQQLIERLSLTFKDGRIVKYTAEQGRDALAHVIETDEGSHRLGEVALVPVTSPCNIGFPLFNTLYDENASCHLAIGQSYPSCLEDGGALTAEQLLARGANASAQHVDFMIGSPELDIDGETAKGELVPVFRHGVWATAVGAARPSTEAKRTVPRKPARSDREPTPALG